MMELEELTPYEVLVTLGRAAVTSAEFLRIRDKKARIDAVTLLLPELNKMEGRALAAEAQRAAIKEAHDELVAKLAKLARGVCLSCEALHDRAEAYLSELDELRALTLAQGKAIETAFALRDEAVRERDEALAALAGGVTCVE